MPRPFRFGFQSYRASSAKEWREKARRAESLGYSSFLLADHYMGPGPVLDANRHPVQDVAAIPAMAVAAEATDIIKVGSRVMCIDYRNPVVLAKELATLDFFSDGRLEAGLGAGWLEGEYGAMGVRFDEATVRIDRLGDVVRMIKHVMAGGEAAFDSASGVRAVGFEGVPKPVQQPHPPIMIGGGSPRVLRLAGQEADIVRFNFNNRSGVIGPDSTASSTAAETEKKIQWVREGAGDRFDDIELEIGAYFTVVTDDVKGTAAGMAQMLGLSVDELLVHPHGLIGSVDGICEELERRRERYGISYVTVGELAGDSFAPVVERLTGR